MHTKALGTSSLQVPRISFGAWAIGGWYWGGADDATSIEALTAGLDEGLSAIDTAPVYGFGHSEKIIGQALRGRRDEALVMTKAGLRWDDEEGEFFFKTADVDGKVRSIYRNLRPASLRHEVEASLRRLNIEHIDLLQIHWPDPSTPIAESIGALFDMRSQGLLREIGVSNFSTEQMDAAREALGGVPLASCQPKYNLLQRESETEILAYGIEHEIGTLVYSPLEQGLLSGKVTGARKLPADDQRNKHPNFQSARRSRINQVLSQEVQPIAEAHGASVAQTVLAWTALQAGVTSVLSGIRSKEQARENAAAARVELKQAELISIDQAFRALLAEFAAKGGKQRGLGGLLRRMLKR
ncbi:MAG: aldo/keto reductase [bacterium]|nr:aldo/keto reductase [Planctomycetota bacterium]HIL53017.1 aldo/keto reductase [Planctomycetota bacterium]